MRLPQPLLRVTPVGDVHADAGEVAGAAGGVASHRALIRDPPDPSVGQDDAELVVEGSALPQGALDRFRHEAAVVGVDPGEEILVAAHVRARREAVERPQIVVPYQSVGLDRPVPDAHPGRVERQTQPLLTAPKRVGGAVPLRPYR
jgi:hypothetical protein